MKLIGNRYRVKSLIGEGGMASIYSAIDEKLDRRVAIKILHEHLCRNQDIRHRFHQEAMSISGLDHPNIIKVYDFSGSDSEQLWIVTEILYGVDLSEYVQRFKSSRLNPVIASLIVRAIGNALEEVHINGIVHRDIKPENIMVLDSGVIKLMDFGIAKVAANANATQTGTFMGSPSYMSPEQIKGSNVDVRTDIYSLSVLLYEILTGVLPYVGTNTAAVISKIMTGRYSPPRTILRELPLELDSLIIKGMQNDRDKRQANIIAYCQELDRFLASRGITDAPQALKQFFKDPKQFLKNLVTTEIQVENRRSTSSHGQQGRLTSQKTKDHPTQVNIEPKPSSKQANRTKHPTKHMAAMTSAVVPPPQLGQQNVPHQAQNLHRQIARKKARTRSMTKHVHGASAEMKNPTNTNVPVSPTAKAPLSNNNPILMHPRRPQTKLVPVFIQKDNQKSGPWGAVLGLALAACAVLGAMIVKNKRSDIEQLISQIPSLEDLLPQQVEEPQPELGGAKLSKVEIPSSREQEEAKAPVQVSKEQYPTPTVKKVTRAVSRPAESSRPANSLSSVPSPSKDSRPPNLQNTSKAIPPKVTASPKAGPGRLRISSTPAGEIYINNRSVGTTNDPRIARRGFNLQAGTYTITVKRSGYKEQEERVRIAAAESKSLNFNLEKASDLLALTIASNRYPTRVTVQNLSSNERQTHFLASGKKEVQLPAGSYKILAFHGGESIIRQIELSSQSGPIAFSAIFK